MKTTTTLTGSLVAGIALATAAGCAQAQSSITLFGTMDAGVTWVSNEQGHSAAILSTGNNIPNFWGLRGSEDLGGGTKAVFLLMDQYNLGTGAIIGNSSGLFARNAYVGLANDRWGSLTAGQQYDFMYDSLTAKGMETGSLYTGFFNYRQGPFAALGIPGNLTGSADFDRVAGTARVSNSIKYTSATYGGFSVGALYGFGGQPGDFSADSAISFGANYVNGAFGAGVAYVEQKYPTMNNGHDGLRNWGAGVHYLFGSVYTNLLYTNTRNTLTGAAINVVQVGADWHLAPAWSLGGDYQYMKGNAQLSDDSAHQLAVALRYSLSKRTLVYVETVYQKARGDNAHAAINGLCGPACASDSSTQFLATLGMSTRF
jgi:predicted porin